MTKEELNKKQTEEVQGGEVKVELKHGEVIRASVVSAKVTQGGKETT